MCRMKKTALGGRGPEGAFLGFEGGLLVLCGGLPSGRLRRMLFVHNVLSEITTLIFCLGGSETGTHTMVRTQERFRSVECSFTTSHVRGVVGSASRVVPRQACFDVIVGCCLLNGGRFSRLGLFWVTSLCVSFCDVVPMSLFSRV